MHEVLDKPKNAHRGEEVEKIKYRVKLDNEIEQIRIKQEQQVTFKDFNFPFFWNSVKFYKLLKVLPKPSKFYKKKKKKSSSSSKSRHRMNNDKFMSKPQDLEYDAGKEKDGEEAVPVIQGGEDPNPITRCA